MDLFTSIYIIMIYTNRFISTILALLNWTKLTHYSLNALRCIILLIYMSTYLIYILSNLHFYIFNLVSCLQSLHIFWTNSIFGFFSCFGIKIMQSFSIFCNSLAHVRIVYTFLKTLIELSLKSIGI